MAKRTPHSASNFDGLLAEEGILVYVPAHALAEQIKDSMQAARLTTLEMPKKMATSRSPIDRLVDPDKVSVRRDALIKVARGVGKIVEIQMRRPREGAAAYR